MLEHVASARRALLGTALPWLRGGGDSAFFARGAFALFVLGVAARLVRFPTNVALARAVGVEEFGTFTLASGWAGVAALVGVSGIPLLLVRFLPAYVALEDWGRARGLLLRSTQMVLGTGALATAAIAITALMLADRLGPSLRDALLILALVLPLGALASMRWHTLRALRRVAASHLVEVLEPLVLLLLLGATVLAVDEGLDAVDLALLSAAVTLSMLVLGHALVLRALPHAVRRAAPVFETREWGRVAAPLVAESAMHTFLSQSDVLLVGLLLGPAEAGLYAVATRIGAFTSFGVVAANMVAQPLIAEAHALGDRARLQRVTSMMVWTSAASAGLLGALLLATYPVLLSLFGADFEAAGPVTAIVILVMLSDSLTGPIGSLLNLTGHQNRYVLILGVSGVAGVIVSVPAIQLWGIEGAAVAAGVGYSLRNAWAWLEVRRRLGVNASVFGTRPGWSA